MIGDHVVTRQPDYQSVLDLRASLAAESFAIRKPTVRKPNANVYQRLPCAFSEAAQEWMMGELDALGAAYVTFRVPTLWGVAIHAFPADVVAVARRLDGRSTGRDLVDQLMRTGKSRDEKWVASTLRAFGATGIAQFR